MAVEFTKSPHSFHIPVMGTGFMIDAPLRIAKYGISSVISLVDDVLIEQMRKFHSERSGEPYEPIANNDDDARSRRIRGYLNLLDRLVARQVTALQASPFEPDSEITRYYSMLPDGPLAEQYRQMLAVTDPTERAKRQDALRRLAVPGSIDVNIMVKGDRDLYRDGEKLPLKYSDASAALRGFAESTLSSSIVLSAGMNPRMYNYAAEFADFFPDAQGRLKKRLILKVSDYHSAEVQGRFLAKRGLWVSEFRVESGLNCGGHAFPTRGMLLGPILEEFQRRKAELYESLRAPYRKTLGQRAAADPAMFRVTVQGGIGSAAEDRFLRRHYGVDGTGWCTPFLLVPEVTNVDDEHLARLCEATGDDVYMSDASPFGLPFWNLRSSASERARQRRIEQGRPGSACSKGYVRLFNTEFTDRPICTASRQYQALKLAQLSGADLTDAQREALRDSVLAKSCICHDLAGVATLKNGIDPAATPAVCCGPNIVNFSRVATLEEMIDHIYGRGSLLSNPRRPHMFLRELELYIQYLDRELARRAVSLPAGTPEQLCESVENLQSAVEHYRNLAGTLEPDQQPGFTQGLEALGGQLTRLEAAVAAL